MAWPSLIMPNIANYGEWWLCHGQEIPRDASFDDLRTALDFNGPVRYFDGRIPDLRARVIMGENPDRRDDRSSRQVGATVGVEKHRLSEAEMPSHWHGLTDRGHHHDIPQHITFPVTFKWYKDVTVEHSQEYRVIVGDMRVDTSYRHSLAYNCGSVGENHPHENIQPSLVMAYIIKVKHAA